MRGKRGKEEGVGPCHRITLHASNDLQNKKRNPRRVRTCGQVRMRLVLALVTRLGGLYPWLLFSAPVGRRL